MTSSIDDIIMKALELSAMIRQSPIVLKYNESRKSISADAKAQRILEQLVLMGESVSKGHAGVDQSPSEYNQLKSDLAGCPIVKKFLMDQREYLNLLNTIMERIKNPR